jgi:5-methyltetrahydrofolate--homocysteine methyltransferase
MKQKREFRRKRYQLSDQHTYLYVYPFAQLNRRTSTPAEQKLWEYLRNRQVDGFKFRRQHVIGKYIADFVCIEAGLVVEVDGAIHLEGDHPQQDADRTAYLEKEGFHVIRFSNNEVLDMTLMVVERIRQALLDQTK